MSTTAPVAPVPTGTAWELADGVHAPITDAERQAVWREGMYREDCEDVIYAEREAACEQADEERARTRHLEQQSKCTRGKRCRVGRQEDDAALAAEAAALVVEYPAVYRSGMSRAACEEEHRWREEDTAEEAKAEVKAAQRWRGDLHEYGRVPKEWVAYERRGATARRAGPAGVPRKRVRLLDGATVAEYRPAALESLAAVEAPGLVVIDSVSSSGCPTGGESVYPWWQAVVAPWLTAGTAVLLLDHTPRSAPRRELGSVTKAAFADLTFAVRAHREGNRLTRVVLEPVAFNDFGTHAEHGIVVDLTDGVPTATAAPSAAVVAAVPTLTVLEAFEAVNRGDLKKRAAADALGMPDTTFRRRYTRWNEARAAAQQVAQRRSMCATAAPARRTPPTTLGVGGAPLGQVV